MHWNSWCGRLTSGRHTAERKNNTDEDTEQTYIAKEVLLPVTEGIYPERNSYHQVLYSDRQFNSPTPVFKVHIYI